MITPGNMNRHNRHPLEVTATGVLQHGRLKFKMFSVLWSDQNEILIYRTFDDFKKLNRQLRKKFPLEAGFFKKSENIIPKLRDVPIFRKNKTVSRCIERLRLAEKYSQELLKIDEKISQCNLVIDFFTPKKEDLAPSFPDDSIVIVLSDIKPEKKEPPRRQPTPPTTEPIVSEQYVCIEDYETKDTKNRVFKVKRNELLGVLMKESTGWWLVENEDKCLAWFPAPYLKDLKNTEDTDSGMDSDDDGALYYVSKTYEATSSDEISVSIGVLVEVIEKSNTGWWLVSYNNKTGYVPSMFLKPYRSYQKLQTLLNQSKFTSTPNLFNPTSAAGPTLLAPRTRSQEEPCVSSNKSLLTTNMRLHRKRSRSLSGLPSNAHSQLALELNTLARANVVKKAQSPPTEWKPKPMERKKGPSPSSSFESDEPVLLKRTMERPLRRHIATDLSDKDNYPEISTEYPKTQPMPSPPQVPQRPKPHEILHKCTTVTKQALQSAGSDF
ncbi:NADPH oxidase organizer 1-like [Discoglossus pictus]